MNDKINAAISDYNNRLNRINRMIDRLTNKNDNENSINEEIQLRTLEAEKRLVLEFIEELMHISE
ncbi:hypothetical protein [Bacillus sp. AG4(2022)]|uniref:hypothetical protein n=1 Tax=Bacillus sp. AG4(2022) TaxID=2962594 RepID=UPI0028819104|nr:hypothetical protein [Bacillus sp. AG4(2022)]MDT0160337.1 hypothetical protein [Bacillus sp. AG4(2022)]